MVIFILAFILLYYSINFINKIVVLFFHTLKIVSELKDIKMNLSGFLCGSAMYRVILKFLKKQTNIPVYSLFWVLFSLHNMMNSYIVKS